MCRRRKAIGVDVEGREIRRVIHVIPVRSFEQPRGADVSLLARTREGVEQVRERFLIKIVRPRKHRVAILQLVLHDSAVAVGPARPRIGTFARAAAPPLRSPLLNLRVSPAVDSAVIARDRALIGVVHPIIEQVDSGARRRDRLDEVFLEIVRESRMGLSWRDGLQTIAAAHATATMARTPAPISRRCPTLIDEHPLSELRSDNEHSRHLTGSIKRQTHAFILHPSCPASLPRYSRYRSRRFSSARVAFHAACSVFRCVRSAFHAARSSWRGVRLASRVFRSVK